jgi:hypothetical protein
VADSSKQVSATITVTSNFLLQLSVPSTVPASSSATFSDAYAGAGIKSKHGPFLELIR